MFLYGLSRPPLKVIIRIKEADKLKKQLLFNQETRVYNCIY